VTGFSISEVSTFAGPTSQLKKIGVTRALNSQASRDDPGNKVRKIEEKPGKAMERRTERTADFALVEPPLNSNRERRTYSSYGIKLRGDGAPTTAAIFPVNKNIQIFANMSSLYLSIRSGAKGLGFKDEFPPILFV
jgi:hypothetical protein